MDRTAFQDLVQDVAMAPAPGRGLDLRIHAAVAGGLRYEAALFLLNEPGLSPACIEAVCRELDIPRYTEDADAAIPGERILCASCAPSGASWAAVQAGGVVDGRPRFHVGWGATEALARRAAALDRLAAESDALPEGDDPGLFELRGAAGPVREPWTFEF